MFSKRTHPSKRSEDVRKSAAKVVDPKKDTPTRAKHLRIFLDNAETPEIVSFFETYYSHIFYIVYDAFITAEINLRQKGAHKAQREELEAVLYLFEKILVFLPEHLARKWQYHSVGRLMSKLLHPGNSWKLLKREAMRLFLLWYQILGESAGEPLHAMFATLVPGFPSPYQGLGLTALAAMTPDTQDGPINPAEICPLIPPQSGERWRSQDTDLTRIFLDVLLELIVSQVTLIEWKESKMDRHRNCLNFLFEKFKTFYMLHIFPDFNWTMSLYRPSLELPEVRKFRPAFVDAGDGNKKMDPMLSCRVVVIKWVAQFTHLSRNSSSASTLNLDMNGGEALNVSKEDLEHSQSSILFTPYEESTRNTLEGNLVREILYSSQENVNFVHEVYRQAFLLSFSHSPAIKKVITVYKDWIQMNVPELPPFLLEPPMNVDKERADFMNAMQGKTEFDGSRPKSPYLTSQQQQTQHLLVRAGLQNVLQIFVTNAANVFLLEVSPEYPILLEEQVEMCKRVLNIYRYMVMNVKMEARTWEQLLFILLQITQLTLPEAPPRRREDTLGGRLAQAIFQTLIVTWIKANLYVVVSTELWDQFLEVLSSLTLWEELIREWAKTMETLTRVLARQVYHLDLNDLPLDRLSERAAKKRRGRQGPQETKFSNAIKPHPGQQNPHQPLQQSPSQQSSTSGSIVGPVNRKRVDSETDCNPLLQRNSRRKPLTRSQVNRVLSNNLRRTMSDSKISGQIARHQKSPLDFPSPGLDIRRYKSADSLHNFFSGRFSDSEKGGGSRSSSPAPSSGLECGSMKDSPIQLDHDGISDSGSHHQHHRDMQSSCKSLSNRSVMSGGSVKGWLPDVAVVLWRRMLGSLGNINRIADTVIHAQIYKYLIELFDILVKIRCNQGVSLDNLSTPPSPEYVPPFTIFAPWCFRALNLPETYQRGKIYALRLLCLMSCRQHDNPLPKTHLVQFYKVMHESLTDSKTDAMNTVLKYTGPRFFSLQLPGYTAYILDFLYAANCVISTSELKGVPRTEATSVVGALLAFPASILLRPDIPLLLPNAHEFSLISSADVKDQIVGVLLKSGKKEPAGLARCISLSSLGIFVYAELEHRTFHAKIKEAIQVLLTALRFNNKAVAQIASDMLLLLADHVDTFLDHYPEVPKRIVEVLARTLVGLTPRGGADVSVAEEEKRLLLSLLLCLGEWTMRMPQGILTQPQEDGRSLLFHVFGALHSASEPGLGTPSPVGPDHVQRREGKQFDQFPASTKKIYEDVAKTVLSPAVMVADFDPNIHVDNTKEGYLSNNSSPLKKSSNAEDTNESAQHKLNLQTTSLNVSNCPFRLGARTLLSHLVNHLFHFPMSAGAAALSSMVSEHDDIPNGTKEELSMEVFKAPNVQLFVLNSTTLMSLVELPALDDDSKADSTVRLILRDISGKFSWDADAMHGLPIDLNKSMERLEELGRKLAPQRKNQLNKQASMVVSRRRNENVLPTAENTAEDMDNLDDLLQYISHTSPECLSEVGRPLNAVLPASNYINEEVEKSAITSVLTQKKIELEAAERDARKRILNERPPATRNDDSAPAFQQSKRLFSQLGLTSWEQRSNVHLLKKTESLLRELKNLDAKRCREAHKIAVIFVGEGQEDKQSILSNSSGSAAYEQFISGLAWEVELETHTGFMGGLPAKKPAVTGETSPYYATSFVEVMFHVATRMPSNSDESMLFKTRHIGNDEVHIVWSEHWRDYRRGILPTEFCDVLIVIYPLKNQLCRIQVSRKPEVPYFGPLFNEMIVDKRVLPGLVRATAVNASRAKRSMLTYYQQHYEERHKALENIIKNHKEPTTFEDFITHVHSPTPLSNLYANIEHSSSRPASLISSTTSLGSHQLSQALHGDHFSNHGSSVSASELTRPRAKTEAGHLLPSGGSGPVEEEHSKRISVKNLASAASKKVLSIKEEPGLPGQTSPPPIPTRKR